MRILACLSACAFLGGCASVARGTTETISIASTPSGAEAIVTGLEVPTTCVTPCAFVAKRNADTSVTIQKDGYEPQVVPLSKDIPTAGAAGFAGNILLGGIIGMGVDAATGAATDHKPKPNKNTKQPQSAAAPHSGRPRRSAPPARHEAG